MIPNKIYHYAAMGKLIITMKTDAISEVFFDGNNILIITNKPFDIKEALLGLKENNQFKYTYLL